MQVKQMIICSEVALSTCGVGGVPKEEQWAHMPVCRFLTSSALPSLATPLSPCCHISESQQTSLVDIAVVFWEADKS